MTEDVETLVEQLHADLAATETLPVERTASRWLGEAQAVAADAVAADSTAAVTKRVEQVADLLHSVEATGHPEADEHLRSAIETLAELDDRLQMGLDEEFVGK